MYDFNQPIKTIVQAREFFNAMEGSSYEMAREFPKRYAEYQGLNISSQTVQEWREALFGEQCASLKTSTDARNLWNLHARLYDVFEGLKTESALLNMLDVTKSIQARVPLDDRVMVAETINGRTVRSARHGLIYRAFDLHNLPVARAFVELSRHFSDYNGDDKRRMERCQAAAQLANDIKLELGL